MTVLSLPGLLVIILGLSYFISSKFGPRAGKILIGLTLVPLAWLVISFARTTVSGPEPGWVYLGYSVAGVYCLVLTGSSALGLFLAKRRASAESKPGLGLNSSDL